MERRAAPTANVANTFFYDVNNHSNASSSNSPGGSSGHAQAQAQPHHILQQHLPQQQQHLPQQHQTAVGFLDSGGCATSGGGTMGPVGGPVPSPSPNGPPPPPNMAQVGVLGPPGQMMAMAPPIDENYCLRWNDYEKKYAETFRVLRDDEYFTDVTLASEGISVKAHRVILSACSNYFHAILKTMSPWQHPVLLLQDVKAADLNSLMDFIYFGQVSVTQDSLQSFLKVAQKLKIKGLCETLAPPPGPVPTAGVHGHVGHAQTPPQVMAPPPVTHARLTPQGSQVSAVSPQMAQGPPALPTSVGAPLPSPAVNANFEGLLPRNPYIPEPSIVPLSGGQTVSAPSIAVARPPISTAPPAAHQSPRQITRGSVPLRASSESIIHYSTPKRPKYASSMSPQSILRNQLSQMKDASGAVVQGMAGPNNGGNEIEVKSEPMPILATEVPSSAVTEFITTHDNDLALTTLGHGISPQFMFSPDPSADNAGPVPVSSAGPSTSGAPPPSSQAPPVHGLNTSHGNLSQQSGLITIDDKTVRLGGDGNGGHAMGSASSLPPHTVAVSVPVGTPISSGNVTPTQQQQHTTQATHHMHTHLHPPPPPPLPPPPADEPQDLTPGPGQDQPPPPPASPGGANGGNNMSLQSTPTSSANNSLVGSPSATPPKKDRNSRKTCGYCHKDFHEMSLKRHIKDVHFRSQNTYVICPQCCKQYASQNSLYSHLNRVHGVKKDMIQSMELQMVSGPSGSGGGGQQQQQPGGSGNGGSGQEGNSVPGTPTPTGENHHEGIMDLAHHSDNSN